MSSLLLLVGPASRRGSKSGPDARDARLSWLATNGAVNADGFGPDGSLCQERISREARRGCRIRLGIRESALRRRYLGNDVLRVEEAKARDDCHRTVEKDETREHELVEQRFLDPHDDAEAGSRGSPFDPPRYSVATQRMSC